MNYKKILAVGLAATMVMGSSVVAFADEGTASGEGKLEGTVNTEVFSVVLPTQTEGDASLAFILDPEGLISKTNQAAYSGKTFGTGTLFFANTGGTTDYSNTSDKLTVTNKSSVKADVSVSATITGNDGITLSSDKTFADDTSASMYLAIVDAANADGVAIDDKGAKVSATLDEAPVGAYEYTYADGAYKYALKADTSSIDFKKYEFQLTGAANADGDWSALEDAAPEVELTWTVVAHSDAYVSSTELSVGNESVTLNAPESVTISSVVLNKTDGSKVTLTSGNTYTLSGTTLGIKSAIVSAYSGATITITYSDSHVDTLTIK